jgi:excisionase family DNA binding protein
MSTATRLQVPRLKGDQLTQAARAHQELAAILAGKKKPSVRLAVDGSGAVAVPREVFELFVAALEAIADREAVTLVPGEKEMTTQEAAEYLNVSRPFVVQLLERGQIPFRKVGSHRRVRFSDVCKYREVDDRKRAKVAAALTREAEALGLEY